MFLRAIKSCCNGFSVLQESTVMAYLEFKSALKNAMKITGFIACCELYQRAVKSWPW